MEVFGPEWKNYTDKIQQFWKEVVSDHDLVLVPGDISWALKLDDAMTDLQWIDHLPGKKVILRGNHDLWWPSASKLRTALPPSIDFIHNNALDCKDVTIGGARLWDTDEYEFSQYIHFRENPRARKEIDFEKKKLEDQKIFARELNRLRMSLEQLNSAAKIRIALTHYPPIGADLKKSLVSEILEEFKIDICVFGHLHSIKKGSLPFGEKRGVRYVFASCDYLDFKPLQIV